MNATCGCVSAGGEVINVSNSSRGFKGNGRLARRSASFLLAAGLVTALCACPAEAGFITGTSANLVATDNFSHSVFINQAAIVGASSQFSGSQNLTGTVLDWTARVDGNALTISLTTSQGLALFGTPRDTFAFTGLSLDAGTNLSDLKLVSETNFDAVVLSTGVNSVTIGINSLDTRFGPLATASFALPVASSVPVPEPASGIILATVLLGFGLSRRRTAVPVYASSISSGGRAGIVPRARSANGPKACSHSAASRHSRGSHLMLDVST